MGYKDERERERSKVRRRSITALHSKKFFLLYLGYFYISPKNVFENKLSKPECIHSVKKILKTYFEQILKPSRFDDVY
jgi:hypothetical protein